MHTLYANLDAQKVMLKQTFSSLPDSEELDLFRMAYCYRHQFDDLAESEDNPQGLVGALSRALSLAVDLSSAGKSYADLGRGIDTLPDYAVDIFFDSHRDMNNALFKRDLCEAGIRLPDYNIASFFEALDWAGIDYHQPENLQQAVESSLLNYAQTATLGLYCDKDPEVPIVSQTRPKKKKGIIIQNQKVK